MREILTKHEKDKKSSRNKIIISIVLAAIMLLSTLGYSFLSGTETSGSAQKVEYNGFEFVLGDNGLWNFQVNGNSFVTVNNPEETENISFNGLISLSSYLNKPLFFNGNLAEARQEIARNLGGFALRMQEACLDEKNCSNNLPVKNCAQDNMVILGESNFTEIRQQENCIFIYSPNEEQTRAADAFIFRTIGVN